MEERLKKVQDLGPLRNEGHVSVSVYQHQDREISTQQMFLYFKVKKKKKGNASTYDVTPY